MWVQKEIPLFSKVTYWVTARTNPRPCNLIHMFERKLLFAPTFVSSYTSPLQDKDESNLCVWGHDRMTSSEMSAIASSLLLPLGSPISFSSSFSHLFPSHHNWIALLSIITGFSSIALHVLENAFQKHKRKKEVVLCSYISFILNTKQLKITDWIQIYFCSVDPISFFYGTIVFWTWVPIW